MLLAQDTVFEQEIKKSRFICLLHRTKSEDEFKEFVKEAKKAYPQARHYCTALKIHDLRRSSDDREPSGTAGRPMLSVLEGSDADEIGAVVVRYFGGTLLGTGGLVKAYSSSVAKALEQASFVETSTMKLYQAVYGYEYIGKVDGCLRSRGFKKISEDYTDSVCSVLCGDDSLCADLIQACSGNIKITHIKDISVEKSLNSHN